MSNVLLIVNHARDYPEEIAGVTVVSARTYLTDPAYSEQRVARVLNCCRVDRYQSRGYYVSLLAEARGHRPLPDVKTLGDLQNPTHGVDDEFNQHVQRALAHESSDSITVDAYFGRDPTRRFDTLAQQLFAQIRAPLLRASFVRRASKWTLGALRIQSMVDVGPGGRAFFAETLSDYVQRHKPAKREGIPRGTSLAILHSPDTPDSPSNAGALDKFLHAAGTLGVRAEIIGRGDLDRVGEFDALFIRDTTQVNHYTYQFARRAASEGLVVVDDPESILRCSNKVFLHELFARHRVGTPRTMMVHAGNVHQIVPTLGFPLVLKQPDSAFSLGVTKIESPEALEETVQRILRESHLVVAQEWLPTSFDWRVGVFDRRPIYVCKYFMAAGHWQVIKREAEARVEGTTACFTIGEVPEIVVKTAVRAANLVGDGLYGVDLKQTDTQCVVMEVNDNPNVDAGNEDAVLGPALYREIVGVITRRVHERRRLPAS